MRFFASVIPTFAVVAVCALSAIADGNGTASAALSDRVLPDEAARDAILSIASASEASGSASCIRNYLYRVDLSSRVNPGMSLGVVQALEAHTTDIFYASADLENNPTRSFDDSLSPLLYQEFSQWADYEQESMYYLREISGHISKGAEDVFYQAGREYGMTIVGYANQFTKLQIMEPYSTQINQTTEHLHSLVQNMW